MGGFDIGRSHAAESEPMHLVCEDEEEIHLERRRGCAGRGIGQQKTGRNEEIALIGRNEAGVGRFDVEAFGRPPSEIALPHLGTGEEGKEVFGPLGPIFSAGAQQGMGEKDGGEEGGGMFFPVGGV